MRRKHRLNRFAVIVAATISVSCHSDRAIPLAPQASAQVVSQTTGPAVMTSPANGSTLSGASVTFQWSAGAGTQYALFVGAVQGGSNYYSVNQGTNLSVTVNSLPTNGSTVYVRLWTLLSGTWVANDYTYTAATSATKAAMISPANGSTLSGASVTFQWSPGAGTQYALFIGTAQGGSSLYSVNQGTNLIVTVDLPTNGSALYVRLWTLLNGTWVANDYVYTAATIAAKAAMISPTNGSTLGASANFQWTAGGGSQYALYVGTSLGASNVYSVNQGTNLSVTVNLPTNGSTLYVRLWTLLNGTWVADDYTYTATTSATSAAMTSPANGSTLNGANVTFQWSPGSGTQYGLYIGTSVGASNLYSVNQGTNLSVTVSDLPTNGSTLYVRLWTLLNGTWVASDYSYTAATLPAAIISPASPSTLSAASATFVWSAGGGTQYSFSISPSCAGPNYYSYQGPDTSVIANNLPTNGSTLCVILSTLINGTWVAADRYWSYTAANLPGTITSPANGSTLNGASATFQWTAGGGKQFSLFVGTSFGASDIYSANQGTNLSVTVNSLPTNGSTLYVRLWTLIGGTWQAMDYTYTAFNSLSGKSSESAVQARRLQWR